MAEFLIYNKDHWMDELTPEQLKQNRWKYSHWDEKYNARYQKGDIVEVRPEGFFTGPKAHGFDYNAFRLVIVKDLKVDESLMQPFMKVEIVTPIQYDEKGNAVTKETILKRRRYALSVTSERKVTSMTTQQLNLWTVEKTES